MRILCVCDQGVNRSVHIASVLKFSGHDTIPVGVQTASPETLDLLKGWADLIIFTDERQIAAVRPQPWKVWLWPIPDGHKRPYNPVQHKQVRRYVDEHRERLIALDRAEPVAAA